MTAKEYQQALFPLLGDRFPELEIKTEWNAFAGVLNQYLPRVDLAIGPFNVGDGPNLVPQYNQLVRKRNMNAFLRQAYNFHKQNLRNFGYIIEEYHIDFIINKNRNSRCLIAIEIEDKNSRKHIMGSIVNAASLGRIGFGIGYSEKSLKTFLRILSYLRFLRTVGKNTYDTTNFFVLSVNQLNELVN